MYRLRYHGLSTTHPHARHLQHHRNNLVNLVSNRHSTDPTSSAVRLIRLKSYHQLKVPAELNLAPDLESHLITFPLHPSSIKPSRT